jgi:uncharacterized protein involved in exopolysaccharide biosynthesis
MSAPGIAMQDEDTVDSAEVLSRLRAKKWWIVWSVLLSTAAFTTAAFIMTPIFRATTVLVAANTNQNSGALGALGQLGGIASLAGINVGSKASVTDEALAVLRSREFTERFIADENLMPRLFARKWNAADGTWKGEPPTPARAYRYFNERIRSVDQDKKTGLITLEIDWKNREEAAAWANELVQRLNQEMRGRAIRESDASLGFLTSELQSSNEVVTREAVGHLMESQIKQRMLADVTKEYAFRVVDRAMAPDADDPVKPQKGAMLAAGPLLGFVIGCVLALVSDGSRRRAAAIHAPPP